MNDSHKRVLHSPSTIDARVPGSNPNGTSMSCVSKLDGQSWLKGIFKRFSKFHFLHFFFTFQCEKMSLKKTLKVTFFFFLVFFFFLFLNSIFCYKTNFFNHLVKKQMKIDENNFIFEFSVIQSILSTLQPRTFITLI